MSKITQWVNLTKDRKWLGEGLTDIGQMDIWVKLKIKFREKRIATAWVSRASDPDNAVYSTKEKREFGFNVPDYTRRRIMTDDQGEAVLTFKVSLAGGDKYHVEVEDRKGKKLKTRDLHTRRKLYFQVIRMRGVRAVSSGDIRGMRDEFWNPAEKMYIGMVEIPPKGGGVIPARRNFNDEDRTVSGEIMRQTRAVYNTSKNPYSFVVLVVRRNGIPEDEVLSVPAAFGPSNTCTLTTRKALFDFVDPAEEYYNALYWSTVRGGSTEIYPIPKRRLTRVGMNTIRINTTGYPQGRGMLTYSMRVLGINGRGLSLPTNNFTLVASEDALTGAPVPSGEIMAVLIHEIAHKIGMVPGPQGTDSLDRQSTYYHGRGHSGGHCRHGVPLPLPANLSTAAGISPDCTMFGDTRSGTSHFCADCKASLRKLDLRARTNVGIRTQF